MLPGHHAPSPLLRTRAQENFACKIDFAVEDTLPKLVKWGLVKVRAGLEWGAAGPRLRGCRPKAQGLAPQAAGGGPGALVAASRQQWTGLSSRVHEQQN